MDPLENNHKQRRFLIIAIIVVVGVLIGLFFFRRGKEKGGDKYRTEVVDRGTVTSTVNATGTLSAVTTVQVGSQVSGIISRLYADFNSQVKQGQLLAELDPTTFQQTVEQRRADVTKSQVDVANTQLTYNRQKRLGDAGLISQSEVDAAKAAYDASRAQLAQSQASLKQAQTNLGYTKIYSPVDGQVVARQYDVGQTVAASFSAPTLFTIAKDLTKMQVQADVDQSDIGQIRVGEPAHFTVDAYPEQTFQGQISQVRLNATVSQNVITYPVIIEVPNPDLKLRPSMTANVTIDVATARDVLRVPNAALRFRPETEAGKTAGRTTQQAQAGQAGEGGRQGQGGGSQQQAQGGTGQGQPGGEGQQGQGRRWRGNGGGAGNGGGEGGAASGANGGRGGRGGGRRQPPQTVYVLAQTDNGKSDLRPVQIRTGISDGKYTQVVAVLSGALNPGDQVVTGVATIKVDASTQGGAGRPGGPRGFGRF